ncbi:MAG: fibronectin type III domain-containing protein, partial [Candidatus Kapaibacterium sp.]
VWNVIAIGRYGAGPASEAHRLTLFSTAPLKRPATANPKGSGHPYDTSFISFTWTQVPDASRYRVQVFRQDAPRTALVDSSVISAVVRLRGFAPSTSYFWRVMASNDRATSQWSDTARFTTNSLPGNTGLHPTFPEMDARNVPTQGELRFTVSESYVAYEIELGTDPEFKESVQTVIGTPTGTSAYTGLKERTQYYWHVVGTTKAGPRLTGPTSAFTTIDPATDVSDEVPNGSPIRVLAHRSGITVTGVIPQHSLCSIYDVLGRLIATKPLVSGSLWELDQPLSEGVVVVVITTPQDVPLWKGALLISQ